MRPLLNGGTLIWNDGSSSRGGFSSLSRSFVALVSKSEVNESAGEVGRIVDGCASGLECDSQPARSKPLAMTPLAPEHIVRGGLQVLFVAACATRNATITAPLPRARLNALWEAVHEIPALLARWRDDGEAELLRYLDEYDVQFDDLYLRATYEHASR
jgi:hypothetical protein